MPRVIPDPRPGYTSQAMQAKIQSVVLMEAVVLPDGTVGSVQVTRSLDERFGLDEEAMRRIRQWRFLPGMRGDKPVAVRVAIEMTFTLRYPLKSPPGPGRATAAGGQILFLAIWRRHAS